MSVTQEDPLLAPDHVPALHAETAIHEFEDGTAVAWGDHHQAVALDAVNYVLLQLVDGHGSVTDLITDVHDVIGIPEDTARARIHGAIELFARYGLVHEHRSSIPRADATDLSFLLGPPNN